MRGSPPPFCSHCTIWYSLVPFLMVTVGSAPSTCSLLLLPLLLPLISKLYVTKRTPSPK